MSTFSFSKETKNELLKLNIEEGEKSLDSLMRKVISTYKKYKFLETSILFKKKLEEKGVSINDITSDELLVVEFEAEEEKNSGN